MARSLFSIFSSHSSSPWSSPVESPSPSHRKRSNSNNPEQTPSSPEYRPSHSELLGSTPLPPMPPSQPQPRLSISMDRPQDSRVSTVNNSQLSWAPNVNTHYGIIGPNGGMPTGQQGRAENQPGSHQRSTDSTNNLAPRTGIPGWEPNTPVPLTPLSAPPFQTSFFPLFGPPGTRQGFIMPADWALNPHGFLISENARRINALALEVDNSEQGRRLAAGGQGGPAVGCRMCAMSPRLMLLPCEHTVCAECGSRFMTSSGGMYCSCGEVSPPVSTRILSSSHATPCRGC